MLLLDTNVLLDAHRSDSPHHESVRPWLVDALEGAETVGLSDVVRLGFVRISTHPRVFYPPSSTAEAFDFLDALAGTPRVVSPRPGPGFDALWREVAAGADASGSRMTDAWLATLARQHGATLVTSDRGFARYPGLRWVVPTPAPS